MSNTGFKQPCFQPELPAHPCLAVLRRPDMVMIAHIAWIPTHAMWPRAASTLYAITMLWKKRYFVHWSYLPLYNYSFEKTTPNKQVSAKLGLFETVPGRNVTPTLMSSSSLKRICQRSGKNSIRSSICLPDRRSFTARQLERNHTV